MRLNTIVIMLLAALAGGCKEKPKPSPKPEAPPPPRPTPTREPPPQVDARATPEPKDPFRPFLKRFCEKLNAGDLQFIARHVRMPLRTRRLVSEGGGNPVYRRRTLRTGKDVAAAGLCRYLQGIDPGSPDNPRIPTLKVKKTGTGFEARTLKGQFEVILGFQQKGKSFVLTACSHY